MELTNHHKDYALEWLLSDEFKISKQQRDMEQQKQQHRPSQSHKRRASQQHDPVDQYDVDQYAASEEHIAPPPAPPAHYAEAVPLHALEPGDDEMDYRVLFITSVLGLQITSDADSGRNCIVEKCLSRTAQTYIDRDSVMVKVNETVIFGMEYAAIFRILQDAVLRPPVMIQFRTKRAHFNAANGVQKMNGGDGGKKGKKVRGFLKVKIRRGVQLKLQGSYCLVQVGNAKLTSAKLIEHTEPEWNELIIFKNFRPNEGKKAVISVYDQNNSCVGKTECVLPVEFNKLQCDTLPLELFGGLCGIIQLNVIIVLKHTAQK